MILESSSEGAQELTLSLAGYAVLMATEGRSASAPRWATSPGQLAVANRAETQPHAFCLEC